MGIVFQDFRLIGNMSVYENVAFAMHVVGAAEPARSAGRVPHLPGAWWIWRTRPSASPRSFRAASSSASAWRARSMNNPKLIIADEPTGNVDPALSFEIVDLLSEINRHGTTVIDGDARAQPREALPPPHSWRFT